MPSSCRRFYYILHRPANGWMDGLVLTTREFHVVEEPLGRLHHVQLTEISPNMLPRAIAIDFSLVI